MKQRKNIPVILLILIILLYSMNFAYAENSVSIPDSIPVLKDYSPIRVVGLDTASKKPSVVLVLSGGSARGFAHAGVLSVLRDYHIPIDLIIGVSMGSIMGGYYAYGYTPKQLLVKMKAFKLSSIINITSRGRGILNGDKEFAIFKRDVGNAKIEDLKIPLVIVATDLTEKKVFIFSEGPLALAMRASSAIPGIFEPVKYRGHLLVDGGVLDDIPVDIARKMGARTIIVSDVAALATLYSHGFRRSILELAIDLANRKRTSFNIDNNKPSGLEIFAASLRLLEKGYSRVTSPKIYTADIVIKPLNNDIHTFDFGKAEEAYIMGREATLKVIDKIIEKIHS